MAVYVIKVRRQTVFPDVCPRAQGDCSMHILRYKSQPHIYIIFRSKSYEVCRKSVREAANGEELPGHAVFIETPISVRL